MVTVRTGAPGPGRNFAREITDCGQLGDLGNVDSELNSMGNTLDGCCMSQIDDRERHGNRPRPAGILASNGKQYVYDRPQPASASERMRLEQIRDYPLEYPINGCLSQRQLDGVRFMQGYSVHSTHHQTSAETSKFLPLSVADLEAMRETPPLIDSPLVSSR